MKRSPFQYGAPSDKGEKERLPVAAFPSQEPLRDEPERKARTVNPPRGEKKPQRNKRAVIF